MRLNARRCAITFSQSASGEAASGKQHAMPTMAMREVTRPSFAARERSPEQKIDLESWHHLGSLFIHKLKTREPVKTWISLRKIIEEGKHAGSNGGEHLHAP